MLQSGWFPTSMHGPPKWTNGQQFARRCQGARAPGGYCCNAVAKEPNESCFDLKKGEYRDY